MKHRITNRFLHLLFIFIFFMITSCGDDGTHSPSTEWGSNKSHCEIKWDTGVSVFDKDACDTYLKIDTANYIFLFNESIPMADSLQVNDIFVIDNFSVCRVTKKVNIGNKIKIYSEPAPLTEAVIDADIYWDYGIDFEEEKVVQGLRKQGIDVIMIESQKYKFEFSYKSIKVTGEVDFKPKEVPMTITFEKSVGDAPVAQLAVEGKFSRFRSKGNCQIRNKELTKFSTDANQMVGEFTVSASTAGSGTMTNIEIPFTLIRGPLPVPFFEWKIGFLCVMNSAVGATGSCMISEKFTYSAEQGLSYIPQSKEVSPKGSIKSSDIKEGKYKDQFTGGAGPVQVAWGIAVPRIEISLMNTTLGWFHTAFLLDGYYNPNPACQKIDAHFYGAAGWGLGMLGVTVASGKTNFWDIKKNIIKSGKCPD